MPPKRRKLVSKKQWGFMFANNPKVARKMAEATIGTKKRGTKKGKRIFGKLPKQSRSKTKRRK